MICSACLPTADPQISDAPASAAASPSASTTQAQDVKPAIAKSIWTAETMRAIRASRDYQALLALIITEAATRANQYPSADALRQAIAKAEKLAMAAPSVTLDPDLN